MKNRVHFIGIGGSGLSAIARLLKQEGWIVTGSDQTISSTTQALVADGIKVFAGHDADHISGADRVIRSSAIPDSNVEVRTALQLGIPVQKRAQFLSKYLKDRRVIAVAGTHGKTTTTGMMALLLRGLHQDPSFIVGSEIKNMGTNAHAGQSSLFVIEADEYDHMFMGLNPSIAVITTLEHDHPDCYPTEREYFQAFVDFADTLQAGGTLITCADLPYSEALNAEMNACSVRRVSYGQSSTADYQLKDISFSDKSTFTLIRKADATEFHGSLQVPGLHNVLNAAAALSAIDVLGFSLSDAVEIIASFEGTSRRFDIHDQVDEITLIDDYAHHPTEIRATLAAARSRFPASRIWAIWQPHTYSRSQLLQDEFATSFTDADQVIVTEVFASREPVQNYSSLGIASQIPADQVRFMPRLVDVAPWLASRLHSGDVVIVLSAGDADVINRHLADLLQERKSI